MATTTNGIATWGDIYLLVGNKQHNSLAQDWSFFQEHSLEDRAKCPTKKEILETNRLSVSGDYADDQCVRYSDISILPVTIKIIVKEEIAVINAAIDYVKVYVSDYVDGTYVSELAKSWSTGNISGSKTFTWTFTPTTDFLSHDQFLIQIGDTTSSRDWYYSRKPIGGSFQTDQLVQSNAKTMYFRYDIKSLIGFESIRFTLY